MSQLLTKNGRKIISSKTKLPIYSKTVDNRIKNIKNELSDTLTTKDNVWDKIVQSTKQLNIT